MPRPRVLCPYLHVRVHYNFNNLCLKLSRRKQHRRKASTSDIKEKEERDLIVNGSTAPPGRFPYSVSLQLESVNESPENNGGDELNNVHTCGGTLISPDVVLTAGHCGYEELGPVHNNNNGHLLLR